MFLKTLSACLVLGFAVPMGTASGQTDVRTSADSLPLLVQLDEAVVINLPSIPEDNRTQPGSRRYSRLEKRVLKVWPYAAFAGEAMAELEAELLTIPEEKARRALINRKEDELKTRFEGELRRLTVREGVILIRLVDREAQRTTYGVLRELKGRLNAFMWQGVARLFGHDLKSEYDMHGEDAAIEHIIRVHGLDEDLTLQPESAEGF